MEHSHIIGTKFSVSSSPARNQDLFSNLQLSVAFYRPSIGPIFSLSSTSFNVFLHNFNSGAFYRAAIEPIFFLWAPLPRVFSKFPPLKASGTGYDMTNIPKLDDCHALHRLISKNLKQKHTKIFFFFFRQELN